MLIYFNLVNRLQTDLSDVAAVDGRFNDSGAACVCRVEASCLYRR